MTEWELGLNVMVIVPSIANNHPFHVGDFFGVVITRVLTLSESLLVILIGHGHSELTRWVFSSKDHVNQGP